MSNDASIHLALRALVAAALAAIGFVLVWSLVSMPAHGAGLSAQVAAHLHEAGAQNPVTAVLLNFRGYDTLLEIAVLTIALLGIWSLREAPKERSVESKVEPSGRFLSQVVSTLVPLMVLIGGYLLWAGSSHPGGAFPAGAVIAAAAVLLLLCDQAGQVNSRLLQWGIVLGLLTFLGVGAACALGGGSFLEYPQGWEKPLILVVEIASTISIALILASVFAGGPRFGTQKREELES